MITVAVKCDKCGVVGMEGPKGTAEVMRGKLSRTGWKSSINNPLDLCPDCYSMKWLSGPVICDLCGADSGFVRGDRRARAGLDTRKSLWRAGWRELGGVAHCARCHKKRVGRRMKGEEL